MNTSDRTIAGYSLTEPGEGWEEILAAFRALGGVADNICLGRGQHGWGLFPIEPDQLFRLHVPENLTFPVEDIRFAGDHIRVSQSAGIPKPEREFFEKYANALSWGGGGRQELSALAAAFDALPSDVRTLLVTEFGMAPWIEGEPALRTQAQFLQGYAVGFRGRKVLVPLFELANHDGRGLEWSTERGVEFAGQGNGEIHVSYGLHDSFSMFHRFAIASREPVAFSLPMNLQIGPIALAIERTFEVTRRGDTIGPQLINTGESLALSFLVLGHSDRPRLPRGAFLGLMKPLGVANADEEFDKILHANRMKFLKLLAALDAYRGELIVGLRNMALYQLEAMSFCVGARED